MKKILKTLLFCFLAIAIIAGCKKNEFSDIGEGTVEAKEYIFNRATKTFDSGDELKSNIAAAEGVKFVYCYLQRADKTDSLIHVTDNKGVISPTYELAIPIIQDYKKYCTNKSYVDFDDLIIVKELLSQLNK